MRRVWRFEGFEGFEAGQTAALNALETDGRGGWLPRGARGLLGRLETRAERLEGLRGRVALERPAERLEGLKGLRAGKRQP